VLSATYGDEAVAASLAKLPHPLVIAFDPDDAGRAGAHRLASLLEAHQHPPVVVDLEHGDLNDTMRRAGDWPDQMARTVAHAMEHSGASTGVSVSR
jgi:orotidine-5'-phosphate decarboxylase